MRHAENALLSMHAMLKGSESLSQGCTRTFPSSFGMDCILLWAAMRRISGVVKTLSGVSVRTLYLFRWCTSMISHLGEKTAVPAYLHISSYATLDILSPINRSSVCNCSTSPSIRKHPLLFP